MVRLILAEAREAGLDIRAVGERLVVRGPKSAESLARQLLASKADVIAELSRRPDPADIARFLSYGAPDESGLTAYVGLAAWGIHVEPTEAGWRSFAECCTADELWRVLRLLASDNRPPPKMANSPEGVHRWRMDTFGRKVANSVIQLDRYR